MFISKARSLLKVSLMALFFAIILLSLGATESSASSSTNVHTHESGASPDKVLTSHTFTVTLEIAALNESYAGGWPFDLYLYDGDDCTYIYVDDEQNSIDVTCSDEGAHADCVFDLDIRNGTYDYWIKHDQYLATTGQFTVSASERVDLGELDPGDCNNDNVVDIADYNIIVPSYGRSCGNAQYDARADFNHDCVVDIVDYYGFYYAYGHYGDESMCE